ncbi:RsmE family RNA methyltransferase [bacterium]|nr:MAG: RsmE family RNA methyltransferase [bacterium]QQR62079.1 MAG: RsmE family RNA methyltransferase [bacterium]QQR63366.1 MAG: RsmE family RNA methyltransferase [bacterium]
MLERHVFALFYSDCDQMRPQQEFSIDDPILYHRCIHVLRLVMQSRVIFFSQVRHCVVSVLRVAKKELVLFVISVHENRLLKPSIILALPVLKGADFSDAVGFATQAGVSQIQLLYTERSQKLKNNEVELARLKRTVIAAAEQAKHFAFPSIVPPIHVADLFDLYQSSVGSIARCDGLFGWQVGSLLHPNGEQSVVCVVGPEADFTEEEYKQFSEKNYTPLSLGPTIFRSSVAACVMIAIVRSLVKT